MNKSIIISSEGSEKGRSFRAELLAYASADSLWEIGSGADRDKIRPVFALLACAEAEASPFVANLRLGRKAKIWEDNKPDRGEIEFLKSAKYEFKAQRHPEGVLVQAYQHDMIRFDLAMVDPEAVKFVLLPSATDLAPVDASALAHVQKWAERLRGKRSDLPDYADIIVIQKLCYLWAKQIFTRARGPIPKDARFFSQALAAMLDQGGATFAAPRYSSRGFGMHERFGFDTWGLERVGMGPGLCVSANHADVDALLAEQVEIYYDMVKE